MKKFSKILMSGLAALCLWACSDEANVSQPANAENDVYVEFGVQPVSYTHLTLPTIA